jgi:hypothetical protein
MAKSRSRHDLSFTPIDAREFFAVLARCLEIDVDTSPAAIISRPMPDFTQNFRDLYLLKEVLRKYPNFDLGIDTAQAAFLTFLEDEAVNAETNDRLSTNDVEDLRVRQVVNLASRKAVTVLGRFRTDWWVDGVRFGPGATTRIGGETVNIVEKLSGTPHVTSSALNLAHLFFEHVPQWASRLGVSSDVDAVPVTGPSSCLPAFSRKLVVRELDKFMTVPKNAVTDRTIGIAPCMNIAFQLGVGYCMRKRMFPWGINLNDQSINQRRAREGSITGRLATLDIKSASNSVTRGCVWTFLGNHSHDARYFDPLWYEVLNSLRTEGCLIDEIRPHEYELFSAMGNGFTFELESLIFWSLCSAVCEILDVEADISVYGDDLIVPTETVPLLTKALAHLGFRLNENKSFSTTEGPLFRESCGVHYLDGRDVTPFYIDAGLDRPDQILLLANNITRWARNPSGSLDGRLEPLWRFVVSHLSKDYLEFGIPFSDANDGLIMSFDQARPSIAYYTCPKKLGTPPPLGERFIGYRVQTVNLCTRTVRVTGHAGLTAWLYEAEKRRFSLPCDLPFPIEKLPHLWEPGARGGGCIVSLFPEPRCCSAVPVIKTPLKIPVDSRKVSLEVSRRVVLHWPQVGPWLVCDKADENPPLTGYNLRNP